MLPCSVSGRLETADSLGLTGGGDVLWLRRHRVERGANAQHPQVVAKADDGRTVEFDAVLRIDTPGEADYLQRWHPAVRAALPCSAEAPPDMSTATPAGWPDRLPPPPEAEEFLRQRLRGCWTTRRRSSDPIRSFVVVRWRSPG